MTRVTRRRTTAVIVAALAVLGLSACTPGKAGSAAIVGGQSLSQSTVNQQALEVAKIVNGSGQASANLATINGAIVSSWVSQQLLADVAEAHGVEVTDAQVTDFLDRIRQQSGGETKLEQTAAAQGSTPPELIPTLIRFYLLGQKLPAAVLPNGTATQRNQALAKEYTAAADRLGVHVNPRYGAWDPTTGALNAAGGQLAEAATAMDGRPIVTSGTSAGAGTLPKP